MNRSRADIIARAAADHEQLVGRIIHADRGYVTRRTSGPGRRLYRAAFPKPMALRILADTSGLDRWTNSEECAPLYQVEPFGSLTGTNRAFLHKFTVRSVDGPGYTTGGGYQAPAWRLQPTIIEMIRRHTRGQH